MSVSGAPSAPARPRAGTAGLIALTGLTALLVILTCHGVAEANPFGVGAPPAAGPEPVGGLTGYILAKQAEFYRLLTAAVREARADGSAFATLGAISFAYGVFHAAGPGHGKAVISSYLLANEATLKRGAGLAFASALLQALTAIAVAGIFAVILGATAQTTSRAVNIIEIAAYGLIVLLGLRLALSKGRGFFAALRGAPPAHLHGPDCDCGADHAHMPDPSTIPAGGGWREWLGAVFSVGLRPCTGAVLVLVFALTQGIFWMGAAATLLMGLGTALTVTGIAAIAVFGKHIAVRLAANRPAGAGMILLRGVEFAAALALVVFGLALLTGYMASEKLFLS
ncbi:nickel/cobalt transporter [Bosea sp. 117]|uniref:nickel/cobalt transporter n=1 Tax=Bosea sp. 117 TaxID=1125973 RepID=UPI0005705FB3|nr:nickel/cobalt transporter [Bosea sp. 117]